MRASFWLWGFVAVIAVPAGAASPLRVRVSPFHAFAPATLQVNASVDPSADNRTLEVVADSADFYRSSQVSLDGDRGPNTVHMELRDLPSGVYQVTVVLKDGAGRARAFARREINVISQGRR